MTGRWNRRPKVKVKGRVGREHPRQATHSVRGIAARTRRTRIRAGDIEDAWMAIAEQTGHKKHSQSRLQEIATVNYIVDKWSQISAEGLGTHRWDFFLILLSTSSPHHPIVTSDVRRRRVSCRRSAGLPSVSRVQSPLSSPLRVSSAAHFALVSVQEHSVQPHSEPHPMRQ